jgi:hypothetical protein
LEFELTFSGTPSFSSGRRFFFSTHRGTVPPLGGCSPFRLDIRLLGCGCRLLLAPSSFS